MSCWELMDEWMLMIEEMPEKEVCVIRNKLQIGTQTKMLSKCQLKYSTNADGKCMSFKNGMLCCWSWSWDDDNGKLNALAYTTLEELGYLEEKAEAFIFIDLSCPMDISGINYMKKNLINASTYAIIPLDVLDRSRNSKSSRSLNSPPPRLLYTPSPRITPFAQVVWYVSFLFSSIRFPWNAASEVVINKRWLMNCLYANSL